MNQGEKFFSVTNATFFERSLLDTLTEDIVTCNVQFSNWTCAYNRLKVKSGTKLNKELLLSNWPLYNIWKRIFVRFSVLRTAEGKLDVEAACHQLYPMLRVRVDEKWLKHVCPRCQSCLG